MHINKVPEKEKARNRVRNSHVFIKSVLLVVVASLSS